MSRHRPTEIKLVRKTRTLHVAFPDGTDFELPCEYLRVFSPSAEVQGHSPDEATLQVGKESVMIIAIEPVGNYAVQLNFDDGHTSGIYAWDTLYELGRNQQDNWAKYLEDLKAAGHARQEH